LTYYESVYFGSYKGLLLNSSNFLLSLRKFVDCQAFLFGLFCPKVFVYCCFGFLVCFCVVLVDLGKGFCELNYLNALA